MRVGDRYKRSLRGSVYENAVFEITGFEGDGCPTWICIENPNDEHYIFHVGSIGKWWFNSNFEFIGNYSKSSNYNNLYDILCTDQ